MAQGPPQLSDPFDLKNPRIKEIFDGLMEITSGRYDRLLPCSPQHDNLDVFAQAVNVIVSELARVKKAAEHTYARKSRFLADMSHEIRTPISAIIAFGQLIADDRISPEKRNHYIDRLKFNCSHLLDLIDSILDLSKIESGTLKTNLSVIDLRDELTQVSESFLILAKKKNSPFK